jgi:hypothetical protein
VSPLSEAVALVSDKDYATPGNTVEPAPRHYGPPSVPIQIVLVMAILVGRAFPLGPWIQITADAALALALTLAVVSGVEYFIRCRKLFT